MFYRFMSNKEMQKLSSGMVLKHTGKFNARTTSNGFCFLSDEKYTPEEAYLFLSGIVTDDVVVEFKTNTPLVESIGIYSDPYGNYFDCMEVKEYCISEYSRETMIPVRYGILGERCREINWYSFN